ncbi:MAG TPA: DNA polymerase I, partial [Candidatus Caccovivens faecavium]|nr:DNA polymerase I [Candidatus Caccovivens faecavium]
MEKFLIVDGNSLANRAYYAMPYLSNIKAEPSGAVFGFANILIKLIVEQKPDFIAVAFDHARITFRNQIYEAYKGTRKETPPDLIKQFPVIKNMLNLMNIKVLEYEGIEADDIIGTLSTSSSKENILLSGDRDLLQLVNKNTVVWLTKKGVTEIDVMDEKAIQNKYGFEPKGIIDLKALMGDASDNIPGVSGVGEKTALSLLNKYNTLDGVYQHIDEITGKLKEKLINDKENAYLSKTLATIKTDCDIKIDFDEFTYSFPFNESVREFFEYWNFNSFLKRDDIFGEQKEKIVPIKEILIDDLKVVDSLVAEIEDEFAYDLEDLKFASKKNAYFLKKDLDLFSVNIDEGDVLKKLKNIFENENILKITK